MLTNTYSLVISRDYDYETSNKPLMDQFSDAYIYIYIFSAANLTLAGFPLTKALGEIMPSRHLNMFNLRLCNAAIIRYSQLKFGHMHLCGMDYKYFSPHCFKCNSFGCTAAIRYDHACYGPHSDSLYSGSEHCQFNWPRLVKREAGFPNPRRALIGSNQLWRVNDSAYFREYMYIIRHWTNMSQNFSFWTHTWWRHQIETFPRHWNLGEGNTPVDAHHKGRWHGALICVWTNDCANSPDTGDLRRWFKLITSKIKLIFLYRPLVLLTSPKT